MDAFTLTVAAALAALTMAASMGLLYLASARQTCLVDWSLAAVFLAVSNMMGAIALHTQTSPIIVIACVNALHIGGHFGMLAGIRRHLHLAPGWRWGAVLVAAVLAAHMLPVLHDAALARRIALMPVIGAINLASAWLLWRQRDFDARASYLPLIVLQVLSALQQIGRVAVVIAYDGDPPGFLGDHFYRTSGALAMLVYLSLATMCSALIVTHQQTLALRRASLTDVLTGWLNRRALHDIATRDFRRCRRTGSAMFFITFDIDHFKAINDRYGHGVGDAAICHVTALSARVLRGYDALFRIGGEEFAMLVVGENLGAVCGIAERLREVVAGAPLAADGATVAMTVSVGVAALDQQDHKWEDILRRADEALYHAKQHGRNRVSVHGRDLADRGHGMWLQAVGA
ncbi:GGDEF domain-containing protein [Massilia putida]|uniref:GGDEF domain-containing protein n=1 Tax=Massilia putida TaxID=1141883 RepID=UPI000953219F|nr:GGDEF domain-containing protein [Massilia putida]